MRICKEIDIMWYIQTFLFIYYFEYLTIMPSDVIDFHGVFYGMNGGVTYKYLY